MIAGETIRTRLEADRAWWVAVREHFLRDLASCDEGDWALLQHADARISELDRAIRRFDSGGYGICERCGAAIPTERLEALPACSLCVKCARQLAEHAAVPMGRG